MDETNLTHRYLWGPAVDQLLADENVVNLMDAGDNEVLWALTDRQSSVTDMVDNDGEQQVHRVFDSFGNVASEDSNASELFAYTARLKDGITGMQNNLNRWYNARIGRWMSEDLIGFAGGDANFYRYVGNAPTTNTDPIGLAEVFSWGGNNGTKKTTWNSDEDKDPPWRKIGDAIVDQNQDLRDALEGVRDDPVVIISVVTVGAAVAVISEQGGVNDMVGTTIPDYTLKTPTFTLVNRGVGDFHYELGGGGSANVTGGGVGGRLRAGVGWGNLRGQVTWEYDATTGEQTVSGGAHGEWNLWP
jgi:RHS repeat-associated protein